MNIVNRLQAKVWAQITEGQWLLPGASVVLGVSGGPDSLCLLDVAQTLAEAGEWQLVVAHLDHGLRPEAQADAAFVVAETARRNLPCHTAQADTRTHARQNKLSTEEAARQLRYRFLAQTALAVGAHTIAVAHTADDQAETVLMHFLRGAGLAGLRGMLGKVAIDEWQLASAAGVSIIRPLLGVTRAEVEAYCHERGLDPRHDTTNNDVTIFRNRLRHELLPALMAYNPNIRTVLAHTAEVLAGEHALVEAVIAARWRELAQPEPGRVGFDRTQWLALSAPEQRALLRRAVHHLRASLRDVDFTPLDQAVRFSHSAAPGRHCDVVAGLQLAITATTLYLQSWNYTPPIVGPQLTEDGLLAPGWRWAAELFELVPKLVKGEGAFGPVWVDAEMLAGPLTLRVRQPGDRYCPLGLGGRRTKLSDAFINAKIPVHLRARWPLVCAGNEIVWIPGVGLDDRCKITPTTHRAWCIQFEQTP